VLLLSGCEELKAIVDFMAVVGYFRTLDQRLWRCSFICLGTHSSKLKLASMIDNTTNLEFNNHPLSRLFSFKKHYFLDSSQSWRREYIINSVCEINIDIMH